MDEEAEGIYIRIACQNQNDSAWFSARCGIVTASRLADAMKRLSRASGNKKKGDYAAAHDDYVRELAREMLTGIPAWHKVTTEMQYGIDKQPEALRAYAKETGQKLTTTGLVLHPTEDYLGASPDSIIAPNGGVEAKVPLLSTHMDNLFNDEIPEEYLPQVYCNMLCAEAEWWDFFSFCPKDIHDDERLCLPDHLRLFIKRAERSKAKLEIAGEVLEGEAVFRRIEEDAKNTMTEAVELVQKLSQSRHLHTPRIDLRVCVDGQPVPKMDPVEMPKEMLLSAGEEPIF